CIAEYEPVATWYLKIAPQPPMLPQGKAPPDEAAPVQIAVRNGDQPDWVLAVRTVGGGAELMHDFKARARLADAEQHSAVVASTVRRPDDVVGAAAAWTILELRDAKARQSNQLRRLRACRECAGYQQ